MSTNGKWEVMCIFTFFFFFAFFALAICLFNDEFYF